MRFKQLEKKREELKSLHVKQIQIDQVSGESQDFAQRVDSFDSQDSKFSISHSIMSHQDAISLNKETERSKSSRSMRMNPNSGIRLSLSQRGSIEHDKSSDDGSARLDT